MLHRESSNRVCFVIVGIEVRTSRLIELRLHSLAGKRRRLKIVAICNTLLSNVIRCRRAGHTHTYLLILMFRICGYVNIQATHISSLFIHAFTVRCPHTYLGGYPMFSEAYTYLTRSLRLTRGQNPDFYTIRSNLKAALSAVLKDPNQPESLKQAAAQRINRAISYTYSRTNPMPFTSIHQSMLTPISPFQQNRQGPYGFVKGPIVPGRPDLVPTAWTQDFREVRALSLMIQEAITIVRRGLH